MAIAQLALADLSNGTCPPVCAGCGAPATHSTYVTVSHTDAAKPVLGCLVGALLGGLAGRLASGTATTTLRIPLPVCQAHARQGLPDERLEGKLGVGALAGLVAIGVVVFLGEQFARGEFPTGAVAVGGLVLWVFVVVFLILRVTHRLIRATDMNERFVTLKNVSAEFAAAVDAEREAAKRAKSGE